MAPSFFDTHTHVNFKAFNTDADAVIRRSLATGIWVTNIGTDLKTSRKAIELAEKYTEGVYASVGLHPVHVVNTKIDEQMGQKRHKFMTQGERFDPAAYRALAKNPKVVAIGEIGLDFYRRREDTRSEAEWQGVAAAQKEDFIKQLDLADELKKAVVIHCRNAHEEILEILEARGGRKPRLAGGIAHFFTGTLEQAERYWRLGFYLAFGGAVTFVEAYQKLVKAIPSERIVVETDAPYVAPAPHRRKRNEPGYVKYVARKIAELKGFSEQEVAAITTENALTVFNLAVK